MTEPDGDPARQPLTPRVVVPEFLPEPHLAALRRAAEVVYDPDLYIDRPRLLAAVASARAVLVRNRTLIDDQFLTAASRLEVVGRLGVGLDNIDMTAAAGHGVRVIRAPGANAVAVAEYVMGAILHLQRGVFSMTPAMLDGTWPRQGHAFGYELSDKTLGLIGCGAIGREVAHRATAFGMRVLAHDPYLPQASEVWRTLEPVEMSELLRLSDVISLHVPLTEETRHLIDEKALAAMKRDAILVNTSRGGVVDEKALADALRDGRLRGAAIDVFAAEPLRGPAATLFRDIGNLILTPHIAGNTHEAVDRVARLIVEAVLAMIGAS